MNRFGTSKRFDEFKRRRLAESVNEGLCFQVAFVGELLETRRSLGGPERR